MKRHRAPPIASLARHWRPVLRGVLMPLVALSLSGCSSLGYYWQSVSGHLALMQAARPVDDWLQDAQASESLKTRLVLARQIRRFAANELALPDNASYQRYADLHRPAVVWNVVAAPPWSLQLQQWCFPVAGCVNYKGYFDEAKAQAEGQRLRAEGLEVNVQPVPAYSTLGWMNWAGGDPLLSTFIRYPEGELARLIFHELAHQVVYAAGDTAFNESFASTVEQLGAARWLASQASPAAQQADAAFQQRRQQFRQLTLSLRRELLRIYGEPNHHNTDSDPSSPPDTLGTAARPDPGWQRAPMAPKAAALQAFRQRYAELKTTWGGYAGYDAWVARTNNAALGAMATYDDLVPGFEALFEQEGRDWPRFYAAVRQLAALPKPARHAALARAARRAAESPTPATPNPKLLQRDNIGHEQPLQPRPL